MPKKKGIANSRELIGSKYSKGALRFGSVRGCKTSASPVGIFK